jgi:hypothetical protein
VVRRSIYLINPKFQLKFSFFVSSLVFIPSLVYPIIIYNVIKELISKIGDPEILNNFRAEQGTLITILIIIHLAFTAVVFVVCIFQSHKIAGPMYKLRKFLENIKQGNTPGHLFFRKGDNFHEIADDFNNAFAKINEKQNQDFIYLGIVQNTITDMIPKALPENKVSLNEIVQKLAEIKERYKLK